VSSLIRRTGPFAHRNPRFYVLFTLLYNARAYYPVLAIFFTDLGLTLERFVLLNLVWAAAIFLLEVPSGALADTIGRKRLLVISAGIMVIEMGILLLAPKDGGWLLFALCIVNRALSGASEAAASGADEAIAYDALPEEGRESAWDEVLATAMRWRAAGFLIAMTLGALLYDPTWLNRGLALLPGEMEIPLEIARRLPVAVVFLQALACLAITLRLEEPERPTCDEGALAHCRSALRLTLRTAHWAFTTRATALIILGGLLIDGIVRNFATINSEYYRLIGLPEWSFGIIGSAIAVLNWFVPSVARNVNRRTTPLGALAVAGGLTLLALLAAAPAWPWFGILPAMFLMAMLSFLGFTVSRSLHALADSRPAVATRRLPPRHARLLRPHPNVASGQVARPLRGLRLLTARVTLKQVG
jgi:MFS family permease